MADVLAHWPFAVSSLIFATFTQVLKATIYTNANVLKYHGTFGGEVIWWGRKTLPIQPVLVGALLGLIPSVPVAPMIGVAPAAHALYFAGAGICSTWVFSVLQQIAKSKGYELNMIIESTLPPPATPKAPLLP